MRAHHEHGHLGTGAPQVGQRGQPVPLGHVQVEDDEVGTVPDGHLEALFTVAAKLIEEASELAEEIGDRFSVAVTSVQRGRIDEDLGRHEEAIARFDGAIEIFRELGARWEMADAIAERGICHRDLGRLDEGERDLRKAMRISEELGEQQIAGWTGRALDRLAQLRAEGAGERVGG